MKVLLAIDTVGGVFTYGLDLIAGLRELGAEVAVATSGAPMTAAQRRALHAAGAGAVHESDLRLEWMPGAQEDVAADRRRLLELAQLERADLVHLSSYAHADADWPVPVVVGAHSCVLSWWRAVHGTEAPAQWDRYREAVAAGLHRADAVVAPTAAMLDEVQRLYGLLPGRTLVIPNGSAVPEAPEDAAKEPLVLAAGRLWDEAKNLKILDEAAAGLSFPVVVAGELSGPGQAPAAPRAVRAAGHLPAAELAALRRRATVFAAPARYEPFGLAALEAARDRCALVLGDIPSLREVWGAAATYVDPADPGQLRDVLQALLEDPAAARRAGDRACRHAAQYTVAAMAGEHLSLYRDLQRAEVAL